ncbi:MAG TPA: DUF2950 domain-containing protein [Myxococcaceae bacterium]|nr:DUF2950 domain-containing protein [Myxococcaceae bacterium]
MSSLLPRAMLCFLVVSGSALAATPTFADPDAAIEALVTAARSGRIQSMISVLGDPAKSYLASGDAVADRTALHRFVELYDRRHTLDAPEESRRILSVGEDSWPFPIPLVQGKKGWSFDAKAGQEEILARRVGQNELDAIQVCLGYVSAQEDYLARNPEGTSVPHYADRLLSSPGKKDGLFWKAAPGEPESPMGPAVSGAVQAGYAPKHGRRTPYRGYFFRILTRQGPHAEGGAMDYREGGKLTRGFALVAYPASYGNSGVMTFLVNQAGVVFEKDLGSKTAKTASGLQAFDPGDGWKPVKP